MANFSSGKVHRTVVRNETYRRGGFNVRERHNERKNEGYGNGDIDLARADLNVHFRCVCGADGQPETYEQTFNRLLSAGAISTHGLQPDAHLFDEMIFDVNTEYFEERGGYEFAKRFFEEAYRLAVKEVGGEEYILSAVMHADERNKAVTDALGREAYHYHLHVVYIPVVRKELYFKKNNKDPELAGKLKEVITQVSHSKKWPIKVPVEKKGKRFFVNAYSPLQDRYYKHMRAAGFDGFERGERGSTAEHLSDLEYKTQQEAKRAAALETDNQQAQRQLAATQTDLSAARRDLTATQNQLSATDKTLADKKRRLHVVKVHGATLAEIETAAKPTLIGDKVTISKEDWECIAELAKLGVVADEKQADFQAQIVALSRKAEQAQRELDRLKAGVKSGDLSVVYSMDEKLQQGKEQAARENASRNRDAHHAEQSHGKSQNQKEVR